MLIAYIIAASVGAAVTVAAFWQRGAAMAFLSAPFRASVGAVLLAATLH